ncbi:MAG: hypothetical protein U0Q19_07535 [Kineosporiaceae bacterium]
MATRAAKAHSSDTEAGVLAEIDKGQQLAGHFPDDEALDRARAVFRGEITEQEALAQLAAKYRH